MYKGIKFIADTTGWVFDLIRLDNPIRDAVSMIVIWCAQFIFTIHDLMNKSKYIGA